MCRSNWPGSADVGVIGYIVCSFAAARDKKLYQ
jgi:hypothetical protein